MAHGPPVPAGVRGSEAGVLRKITSCLSGGLGRRGQELTPVVSGNELWNRDCLVERLGCALFCNCRLRSGVSM